MTLAYNSAAAPAPIESQPYFEITMGFLPWRRYFARSFDNALYFGILALATFALLLNENFKLPEVAPPPPVIVFLAIAAILPLAGLITALLISQLGTTPGKFIFGIHIREPDGTRLSFRRALRREFHIWFTAYACGVPILSHFAHAIAFGYIETNHRTWWDVRTGTQASYRSAGIVQQLLWLVVILLILFRANLLAPLIA